MTTEVTAELNELRNQVCSWERILLGVFGLVVVAGLIGAMDYQEPATLFGEA